MAKTRFTLEIFRTRSRSLDSRATTSPCTVLKFCSPASGKLILRGKGHGILPKYAYDILDLGIITKEPL